MMKSKVFLFFLSVIPFLIKAQSLVDVNITIKSVTHSFQCNFDNFIINDQPEPRWKIKARAYSIGNPNTNYYATTTVNPGLEVNCGELLQGTPLQAISNSCADNVQIEIESWEEDGGTDANYDAFGGTPDENHSIENVYLYLGNFRRNIDTTFIVNQGNGYSVEFIVNWKISVSPTITSATKDTVCIGSKATLIASHTTQNSGQFSWYADANLTKHVFSGGTFVTPNINAQTDFWVTESVVGGCVVTPFKTTVNTKALPAIPTVNSPSVCAGRDTLLSAKSPVANPTFTWYADTNAVVALFTGADFRTPGIKNNPTKFFVEVKDNSTGCTSGMAVATVGINPTPTAPIIVSNAPICDGDTLKLFCTASGLGYAWSGPFGFSSSVQNPVLANANEDDHQGFYNLVTTNLSSGCKSDPSSILIDVNRVKNQVMAYSNGKVCERDTIKLSATSIPGATYSWTGPNGFTSNVREPKFIGSLNSTGKYMATVKLGKCFSAPIETEVTVLVKPDLKLSTGDTITSDVPYVVTAESKFPTTWYPLTNFDNPTSSVARVKLPLGANVITCIASNQGCETKGTINVFVKQGFNLNATNLMTPNGDGLNDRFVIPNINNFTNYSLTIFNRGGMEVYATTAYANDWEGNWKGNLVPDGSYWWVLKTADRFYKGAITIKR